MAHTAFHVPAGVSFLSLLAAPFVALGKGIVALGEASARTDEINRLNALSDAELAELGVTRDGIVLYVFRDHAGI